MSKFRISALAAGLALAASGAAMAAGPVGTAPSGGFSIDDALFNAANVGATPCPAGNTCTTLTGSGGQMLQREVTDNVSGLRYIQTIIGDTSTGEFANESRIQAQTQNQMASKMRIDEGTGDDAFFTEHTFYRGTFDASGGFPALELVQNLGEDFQTFYLETPNIPNNGAASMAAGRVDIDQTVEMGGGIGDLVFAHRVLKGAGYAPTDFSVSVTDGNGDSQSITIAGGAANSGLTATYIGNIPMPGGGPGVDGLPAAQREFGVMVYRYFTGGQVGNTTTGGVSTQEIRATSQLSNSNDSGEMSAGFHGAFVNGDAVSMGWDETLFGAAPL